MQIFSVRGTNPSRREAGMRMGLLSKEMIALPPQSDNHEKLTVQDLRSGTAEETCAATITQHTHKYTSTHTPQRIDRLGMGR